MVAAPGVWNGARRRGMFAATVVATVGDTSFAAVASTIQGDPGTGFDLWALLTLMLTRCCR